MLRDVNSTIKRSAAKDKKSEVTELYRKASGIGDRVNPESVTNVKANKTEEAILGMMLLKEEHLKTCVNRLTGENFVTPFCKKVFESIASVYKTHSKFDIGFVEGEFTLDEVSRIMKMQSERGRLSVNDDSVLEDYINSLLKEKEKSIDSDTFDSILSAIKNKKN